MEPSSITDSKQACFAGIAAPTFQEEGDGLLPLVTRCEILILKKIFYQRDASRIKEEGKGEMYRLSSSNLIRKGLARVHLFVLSLRYRYALCFTRHADKTGATFL